jgi:hypothetical protein
MSPVAPARTLTLTTGGAWTGIVENQSACIFNYTGILAKWSNAFCVDAESRIGRSGLVAIYAVKIMHIRK